MSWGMFATIGLEGPKVSRLNLQDWLQDFMQGEKEEYCPCFNLETKIASSMNDGKGCMIFIFFTYSCPETATESDFKNNNHFCTECASSRTSKNGILQLNIHKSSGAVRSPRRTVRDLTGDLLQNKKAKVAYILSCVQLRTKKCGFDLCSQALWIFHILQLQLLQHCNCNRLQLTY